MNVIEWDGKPISKPCIYSKVPIGKYHRQLTAGPSASRSGLWRLFDASPAHYFLHSPYNPKAEESDRSEPLIVGQAAHHLLLGEADFHKHFAVRPDEFDSWRTKAAKDWRALKEMDGLGVLEPKHMEMVRGMALSLAEEPMVQQGILNGLIEHTLVAQDPVSGVWMKIRPDAIPTDSGDVADLKTAADISDDGIETALGRDGLVLQGAMTKIVFEALGFEFNSFTLVFVEKTPPYCVQTRTLLPADIELGEAAIRASLKLFAKCMKDGIWHGPGGAQTDAQYISLKPWHRTLMERRIAIIEAEL